MSADSIDNRVAVPDPPRAVPPWFFVRRMQGLLFAGVFTFLFGGLGTVVLGAVAYVAGGQTTPLDDWRLNRDHATATAVVTNRQMVTHSRVNGRHPWRVRFQFTTPAGKTVEAVGHTYAPAFDNTEVGQSIGVEYDPAEPTRARPAGGSAATMPLWFYGLMSVGFLPMPAIGIVLLATVWRKARRERYLLTYGVAAEAEIVGVELVRSVQFGRRHPFNVQYRFFDHRGVEVFGRDRTYHYAWAEALRPGDKVAVIYNPQWPAENVLWLVGEYGRAAA